MFNKIEDIPFNLDPFDLDISYKHATIPSELEKYIDGTFFIELVKEGPEKFNIEFISFFDARTYFVYDWDGEKLTRIKVENASLYEEESDGICDMYSSDDEIWDEAIGYEEVPQQAIDYAEKNNLVKIIYS